MPLINCFKCNRPKYYSPSHVPNRAFCSRSCYAEIRDKEIEERGKNTRLTGKEKYKITYNYGINHWAWKGDGASYRALHYWLRRNLGKPNTCKKCGKFDERPRFIQWANIDGLYRRVLTDYISLCVSCHKLHDLKLKAKKDSPTSNQ